MRSQDYIIALIVIKGPYILCPDNVGAPISTWSAR